MPIFTFVWTAISWYRIPLLMHTAKTAASGQYWSAQGWSGVCLHPSTPHPQCGTCTSGSCRPGWSPSPSLHHPCPSVEALSAARTGQLPAGHFEIVFSCYYFLLNPVLMWWTLGLLSCRECGQLVPESLCLVWCRCDLLVLVSYLCFVCCECDLLVLVSYLCFVCCGCDLRILVSYLCFVYRGCDLPMLVSYLRFVSCGCDLLVLASYLRFVCCGCDLRVLVSYLHFVCCGCDLPSLPSCWWSVPSRGWSMSCGAEVCRVQQHPGQDQRTETS